MKNITKNIIDIENTIINNNLHIKNEKHVFKDYKNSVCIKPWGYEFLIFQNTKIGIWFLKIEHNKSTSLHTHFNKDTIIIVLKGSAKINLINDTLNLNIFDCIFLPHYNFHGLSSFSEETYLIEIEIYNDNVNFSDKNDLLRIDDPFKRNSTGYESSVNVLSDIDNLENFEYFYLNDTFKEKIFDVDFEVTNLNKNNYSKLIHNLKKQDYNIILQGTIFQKFQYLKEGTIIKNFDDIQFPNDEVLILSLSKYNYKEDSKIIYNLEQLKIITNELNKVNKKVILSSGCFDILHTGHLNTLREAKKLGDVLIVCLSSDEQIKLLKGNDRPINSYQDRIDLFKTISYVDYIVLYNEENIDKEETLDKIMLITKPEIWVKGSDYEIEKIKEKHPHLKNIKLIKNIDYKSTTNIIKKIKN